MQSTNSAKSTKKSLVASGLSLLVCLALLIGTTFAWFTDSVTNSGNKIEAGMLDIELEELNEKGEYVAVGEDPIFDYNLWEPGYSDAAVLRVRNNGTLALKWNMQLTANGDAGKLGDVIDVYAKVSNGTAITTVPGSLEDAISAGYENVGTLNELMADPDGAAHGILYAATNMPEGGYYEAYAGIVLHMRENAGNEYQGASIGTTFDIVVNATQYTYETDGFGSDQYDQQAPAIKFDGAQGQAAFEQALADLNEGETLEVSGELNLTSTVTINKSVTIQGADENTLITNKAVTTGDMIRLEGNGITVTIKDIALNSSTENQVQTNKGGAIYAPSAFTNSTLIVDNVDITHYAFTQQMDRCNGIGIAGASSVNNTLIVRNSTIRSDRFWNGDTSMAAGVYLRGTNTKAYIENTTIDEGEQGVMVYDGNSSVEISNNSVITACAPVSVNQVSSQNGSISVKDSTLNAYCQYNWADTGYGGCVRMAGSNWKIDITNTKMTSAVWYPGNTPQKPALPIVYFTSRAQGNVVNIDSASVEGMDSTGNEFYQGDFLSQYPENNTVYVDGAKTAITQVTIY